MNATETTHPSHQSLAAFNSGRLGPIESAEIERHLADCQACCGLLKTLPNDTLISLLGPQSDTKAEVTPFPTSEQHEQQRPVLDVTIAPGEFKTQTDGKSSAAASTEVPAELQGHPRYRIQALLGRGGMGSVFRAEHRVMNRPVALKVIDRQLVQTPGLVERFHREVQAAAKLSHPNIVTAYDAEQAGDLHFLVMELVEGHDLAEVVRQRGKLPVQEACEYVRQAALGLQHASERGMVHRDIKPQNLMLQASPDASAPGVIKILDFGLAQFATEIAETSGLTQVGAMMGTPDYMAPEQARDAHSADIRADIYSLGCTLYCLLSGGAPFPQGSIVEKIMSHVERQPVPLQELRPDVPAGLVAVLAKMMAKLPGDRFQTPAEVAEALLPFVSTDTAKIAAEVVSPITKAAARKPRSPLFVATAVLAVLATTVLLGVVVVVTDQGRIEVRSEVDDVELLVKRGGEQIDIIDVQTGSKATWFFSGEYKLELKGDRNDIAILNDGFQLTRWGKQIVTLTRKSKELAATSPAKAIAKDATPGWHGWTKDAPPPAIAPFDSKQAKQHQEAWAKYLGAPTEYTNSIGMKFVLIPPGEFTMGSTPEEIEAAFQRSNDAGEFAPHIARCAKSQGPQHRVILTQPYYLGVCEVTQSQYEQVMGKNPSHFSALGAGKAVVVDLDTAQYPVEMVSWNDTAEFCARLSLKDGFKPTYFRSGEAVTLLKGNGYRLPTEAQWEFASRAGTTTKYWTGNRDEALAEAAWLQANSGNRTHVVGELKANPLGLFDIHGNVLEWCQDTWALAYYRQFQEQPALDPAGAAMDTKEPDYSGPTRVIRGGCFNFPPFACLATHRHHDGPPGRYEILGFRILLPVDATRQVAEQADIRDVAGEKSDWPKDAPPPAIAPFDGEQAKQHQEAWATYLHVPVEHTNSVGMKFRLIPPGEFTMGSTPENVELVRKLTKQYWPGEAPKWEEFLQAELPRHKVILTKPFYLGVHEVTQAHYAKVMGENPSHFSATGGGKEAVAGMDTASFPAEMVNWHDAVDFCAKLSQQEKLTTPAAESGAAKPAYRLPTEAEWEYACRAGTTERFWFGDQFQNLEKAGWAGTNRTHAVGGLKPNPFALYDMHGNVGEWAQDLWEPNYYAEFKDKPALDPACLSSVDLRRVARGGLFHSTWMPCQASSRAAGDPFGRINHAGMRVALSVDAVRQATEKPAVKNPVVPTGTNLITDPSLEQTAVGEKFPAGWGSGNLIPPGAYQFSVAEGGKSGKKGWLIEGHGQYAVIPTNRPGVDRALRYGARGWVRLESGSAQLKILYFDGNGRYLGENRGAITNKRDGWQQLTMLDDLAKWPEARYLSLAPTLIGKGKAVFDDLEFTAFDATKLPANFEKDYASTPKHDLALFDRWAGRWESVTEYKATAATPAKTVKAETIVRKVLDDQFLLWQWKGETGDAQYLTMLGFDENAGSYHIWVFGSAGEVFERTGQWDAVSQTLALDLKAPTPGVSGISTDRFTDKDYIESLILVKDAGGQITRDIRATWTRKAAPLPADIELSGGPAAGSAELALVQKMAGDWTIRSTSKPSVWEPKEKSETFTEQVAWTNGGRLLIFRAYDEAKRMTSLSLMTYEPKESSYHFWTFAKGVYGGQWRITWDASSRAFHWRSIDMPAGWVGTGFNRWVDDDTFDNQALIKDETGRVLLDSTQEKRRKK